MYTPSASITVGPQDSRCKYVAKLVRKSEALPLPSEAASLGMRAIAGGLARNGQEELFVGDVLFELEEMHHRKERGWRCRIVIVGEDGEPRYVEPTMHNKAIMKLNGLDGLKLAGAGPLAACVRVAHAIRDGVEWE